jgi:hypothetical protein
VDGLTKDHLDTSGQGSERAERRLGLALSTSVLGLKRGSAGALLERWRALSAEGGDATLSLDPRIPPAFQDELLVEARARGLRATEVAHPFLGPEGLPAASFARADPHELRAAASQLRATLERCSEHAVSRVVLYPTSLELAVTPAELRRRHALALPRERLATLAEERRARAGVALDGLALLLDAVLGRAEELGLVILLPTPAAEPHKVPAPVEIAALFERLAGAPLSTCHATDWAHARAALGLDDDGADGADNADDGRAPGAEVALFGPPVSVRLADACGLTLRLPLSAGEVDWSGGGPFPRGEATEELVLTLDVSARPDEVAASFRLASRLAEPPPRADT